MPEPQTGQHAGRVDGRPPPGLTPDEFADELRGCAGVLWLVAAAVVGRRDLADDAVQEAAILGLRKLGQFQRGTNFAAWMSQMVRHAASNMRRREERRRGFALDAGPAPGTPPLHDTPGYATSSLALTPRGRFAADQQAFDDRVLAALAEVSETARACLLLRTVQGLDYTEISRLLDIPPGTAMSHVHRSRALLRTRLADLEPRNPRIPRNPPSAATTP